jgi:hypothetical protein
MSYRSVAVTVLLVVAVGRPLAAQSSPVPAASWDSAYAEIKRMAPAPDRTSPVSGLVLQREAGQLVFTEGSLALLTPLGGRTMGAAFKGRGTFLFSPRTEVERQQLTRLHDAPSLSVPFTEVVLLFSDSTLAELERQLTFAPGGSPNVGGGRVSQMLDFLGDERDHDIEPDVMLDLLNRASGGLFYAHIVQTKGDPLMFLVSPREREGVELRERKSVGLGSGYTATSVKEAAATGVAAAPDRDRQGDALVRHYALDVSLPSTGSGDIGFRASARMIIAGQAPIGPWIAFGLFSKFTVDSARWADGTPAVVVKKKDSSYLWVRLPAVLPAGETAQLTLYYHGDLIDRYGDFFYIKASTAWYPRPLEGRSLATFEMIYHCPSNYLFASVGERMDSSTADRITTSRWVTARPIRNASFNLGMFKSYQPVEPGAPPVTLLVSESGHRTAGSKAYSAEEVGRDIARSMKLFTTLFGPPPADQFYATEIPAGHGEAFPGLIHLSAATFGMSGTKGYDEVFRSHEVAHQWWGIGVDFATYRDQWLSEGFSDFAALWYLQVVRGDVKQYFSILDQWKADLMVRRAKTAPIALGYRVENPDYPGDYSLVVYEKGAWVLHMLRTLMIDLKTMNEDRFSGMMKDFYQTYRGKQASTDDFRRMVEKHTGQDMEWFFSEWVDGSAIPTYRAAYQVVQAPDGKFFVKFRVRQQDVPDGFRMYVPVSIELEKDQWVRVRKQVTGPLTEFELGPLPSKPKSVKFNDLNGVLADVKMVGWDE